MRERVSIVVMFFAVLISACKKGDKSTPDELKQPGKSLLLFPAQNSVCTTAANYSPTQSTVTLNWTPSDNTDRYTLTIKNLITGSTADTTVSSATITLKLLKSTPYAWFVTSKLSTNTAAATPSDTWKFYVPGPAEQYFAPFPAIITSPVFDQNVSPSVINLAWAGSDPDNDITGYDVYFGIATDPPVYKSNVTNTFLNGIAITSGTKYYWKIITKDSKGNNSSSGIYQFTVR
jgi:hypothetical protein